MLDLAIQSFGRIDLLHNNAAATQVSIEDADIVAMEVGIWDHTMAVNLRGALLGCKHAIPHMVRAGGGVIVNTSSGAGTLAEPVRVAYGASKAALEFPHAISCRAVWETEHSLRLNRTGDNNGNGGPGPHH